jgi:hypothetical protein
MNFRKSFSRSYLLVLVALSNSWSSQTFAAEPLILPDGTHTFYQTDDGGSFSMQVSEAGYSGSFHIDTALGAIVPSNGAAVISGSTCTSTEVDGPTGKQNGTKITLTPTTGNGYTASLTLGPDGVVPLTQVGCRFYWADAKGNNHFKTFYMGGPQAITVSPPVITVTNNSSTQVNVSELGYKGGGFETFSSNAIAPSNVECRDINSGFVQCVDSSSSTNSQILEVDGNQFSQSSFSFQGQNGTPPAAFSIYTQIEDKAGNTGLVIVTFQ